MGTGRLILLYAAGTFESIALPLFRDGFQKDATMSQFAAKEAHPNGQSLTRKNLCAPPALAAGAVRGYARNNPPHPLSAIPTTATPMSFRRPPPCHFDDLPHVISTTEGRRNLYFTSRQARPAPPNRALRLPKISTLQARCRCARNDRIGWVEQRTSGLTLPRQAPTFRRKRR